MSVSFLLAMLMLRLGSQAPCIRKRVKALAISKTWQHVLWYRLALSVQVERSPTAVEQFPWIRKW